MNIEIRIRLELEYDKLEYETCLLITKTFLFWIFWRGKMRCFWVKKAMKIWYLLIMEKFLFWSFREWEIQPFLSQKVDGKMLFTDYGNVLVLNFSVIGKMVFFWVEKLMERWYLLTNWKRLQDTLETNKMFTGDVRCHVTNLYLTNLYLTNLGEIQNALVRTK